MKFTPNLVVGVIITLIGAVLILDRLHLVEIGQALRLWPLLLVLFGVSVIVQSLRKNGDTDGQSGGRPIIGPGLVLFLTVVSILAWRTDGRNLARRGEPTDARMSLVGILGQDDRVSVSNGFKGAEMTSLMGRTRLDLRKATLASDDEVIVDIFGMWGAVELFVPEDWTVDTQAWAIMGGVDDRRGRAEPSRGNNRRERGEEREDGTGQGDAKVVEPAVPAADNRPAAAAKPASSVQPRLVIRGMVLMGGLVIRS